MSETPTTHEIGEILTLQARLHDLITDLSASTKPIEVRNSAKSTDPNTGNQLVHDGTSITIVIPPKAHIPEYPFDGAMDGVDAPVISQTMDVLQGHLQVRTVVRRVDPATLPESNSPGHRGAELGASTASELGLQTTDLWKRTVIDRYWLGDGQTTISRTTDEDTVGNELGQGFSQPVSDSLTITDIPRDSLEFIVTSLDSAKETLAQPEVWEEAAALRFQ